MVMNWNKNFPSRLGNEAGHSAKHPVKCDGPIASCPAGCACVVSGAAQWCAERQTAAHCRTAPRALRACNDTSQTCSYIDESALKDIHPSAGGLASPGPGGASLGRWAAVIIAKPSARHFLQWVRQTEAASRARGLVRLAASVSDSLTCLVKRRERLSAAMPGEAPRH